MRYKTIFVMANNLDCSDSAFLNSLIICYTTIEDQAKSKGDNKKIK
jgi:hypothetical protein